MFQFYSLLKMLKATYDFPPTSTILLISYHLKFQEIY